MELEYWAATDIGRKRTHNEDNFLIDGDLKLFVVADGMGGHAAGEIASALAVHSIRDVLNRERDLLTRSKPEDPRTWHLEICTLLEYAVHVACERIFEKARKEPEKRGMGTTVVALLVIDGRGYIAHVGDSRIYLLRSGVVYQLTEDHSMMNEMIRRGSFRADDFDDGAFAAYKRAMTRAVGPGELVEVDTLDFDILPDDALLMCSDGLYEYLDEHDMSATLALPDIREVPARLLQLANHRGGKDNITALVVRAGVPSAKSRETIRIAPTLLRRAEMFEHLSNHQITQILEHMRVFEAGKGQVIFTEGDIGQAMYLVIRGSVELTVDQKHVATIVPGGHFGEMALVDDHPRSASATVREDAEFACLGREEFRTILRRDAELAVPLLWGMLTVTTKRLRETTQLHIATLALSRPPVERDVPTSIDEALPETTEGATG